MKWVTKDLKTLKALFTGKGIQLDTDSIPQCKNNSAIAMLVAMVLMGFFSGAYLSATYYQGQCNIHIAETFYPELINPGWDTTTNNNSNVSLYMNVPPSIPVPIENPHQITSQEEKSP